MKHAILSLSFAFYFTKKTYFVAGYFFEIVGLMKGGNYDEAERPLTHHIVNPNIDNGIDNGIERKVQQHKESSGFQMEIERYADALFRD